MDWFDRHARFRKLLSPSVDRQLAPPDAKALQNHLESCEACRHELDELRATVSVLRDLPEADVPRSFALTPEVLRQRGATRASAVPPLALGMRLASAGVAVVLAVLVVGDFTGVGIEDNGDRKAALERGADSSTMAELGAAESQPPAADQRAESDTNDEVPDEVSPSVAAESTDRSCPAAESDSGASPAATPAPSPDEESMTAPFDAACVANAADAGATEGTPGPEDTVPSTGPTDEELTVEPAPPASDGGDGLSTVRIAELALASSLVVLIAAVVVEFALRRQREV